MADKRSFRGLLIAFVVILAVLVVLSIGIDFGLSGTDDRASELVLELRPDHTPWFASLFELGDVTERLLFALQIALGVGLGVYFFLRLKAR